MTQQILVFAAKYIAIGILFDALFHFAFARTMGRSLGHRRWPGFSHVMITLLWPTAIVAFVSGVCDRAKR